MWIILYKPDNESQPWSALKSYGNKASAISHASLAATEYFIVKVTDPDGSVIWAN